MVEFRQPVHDLKGSAGQKVSFAIISFVAVHGLTPIVQPLRLPALKDMLCDPRLRGRFSGACLVLADPTMKANSVRFPCTNDEFYILC